MIRGELSWFQVVTFLLVCVAPTQLPAEGRVALLIGNSEYRNSEPLRNSVNDAEAVAFALRKNGYATTKSINVSRDRMKRDFLDWVQRSEGAKIAVFYFSGYSVEWKGESYLLPIDATLSSEKDLQIEGVALEEILEVINRSRIEKKIIVLDSCRESPFSSKFQDVNSGYAGLSRTMPPRDAVILFAGSPKTRMSDGLEENSPFTAALLEQLEVPGLSLRALVGGISELIAERGGERPMSVGDVIAGYDDSLITPAGPSPQSPPPMGTTGSVIQAENGTIRVPVYFGTNRKLLGKEIIQKKPLDEFQLPEMSVHQFSDSRSDPSEITFGRALVSLPVERKMGEIPRPSFWKLEFTDNPRKHVVLLASQELSEEDFSKKFSEDLAESESHRTLLFIHGRGTSFEQASLRTAQLFLDLKFDGVPVFFSWPSTGGFMEDKNLAQVRDSRDSIADFVQKLIFVRPHREVFVIAQDLGSECLSSEFPFPVEEANQWRSSPGSPKIEVILTAPTITRSRFLELSEAMQAVGAPVTVYLGGEDQGNQKTWMESRNAFSRVLWTVDASMLYQDPVTPVGTPLITFDAVVEDISELIKGEAPETRRRLRSEGRQGYFRLAP